MTDKHVSDLRTLNLELQGQDQRVAQLKPAIEQVQVPVQVIREEKSSLEDDLLRDTEQAAETQNLLDIL